MVTIDLETYNIIKQQEYSTDPTHHIGLARLNNYDTILCVHKALGHSVRYLSANLGMSKSQIQRDMNKIKRSIL